VNTPHPAKTFPPHADPNSLAQLRTVTLRTPVFVITHLRWELITCPRREPARRIDLQILLAEALHRQGSPVDALRAVAAATETLHTQSGTDWPRLLTILAVSADITTTIGDRNAVTACENYRDAVTVAGTGVRPRLTLASALHAAAVHQHDCGRGRALLDALRQTTPPAGTRRRDAARRPYHDGRPMRRPPETDQRTCSARARRSPGTQSRPPGSRLPRPPPRPTLDRTPLHSASVRFVDGRRGHGGDAVVVDDSESEAEPVLLRQAAAGEGGDRIIASIGQLSMGL
jgi:hypothetical protein